MDKIRVNYCIATWSGERNNTPFDDSHIQKHIDHLNTVNHNLAQVSIGRPENPDEDPEFAEYLQNLEQLDDGTPIVVYDMKNAGMSYGQWSRIYLECLEEFSHYIFIEDDYVPIKNDFDSILVEMYQEKYKNCKCGFLCGLVFDATGRYGRKKPRHAGISNGITSSNALQKVVDEFGSLVPDPINQWKAQIVFSSQFIICGFEIDDYLDQYRTIFYDHIPVKSKSRQPALRIYESKKEDLIIPIQCLDTNVEWSIKSFAKDGTWEVTRDYRYQVRDSKTLSQPGKPPTIESST